MNVEDGSNIVFKYGVLAILILIIILFFFFSYNNDLTAATIHDKLLCDEWYENLDFREVNSDLLGFEKWSTIRYEVKSNYTNYLMITTIKTLILLDENELTNKIDDMIESILERGITIDKSTKISGERLLKNGHKSQYIVFDGVDKSIVPIEKIRVIAEVWNCGFNGNSIICFGYSQLTDNFHNNSNVNTVYWEKIVSDPFGTFGNENYIREDGLIYNIVCH